MDRDRLLAPLRLHGWDATSFQTVKSGFSYWFDDDDAFVAYVKMGRVLVTTGAPIAPRDRVADVAKRFVAHAKKNGNAVCFFGVEKNFVDALPYPHSLVGLQPVWDPAEWNDTLKSAPSLREQLRRARAKKIRVRLVQKPELEGALRNTIQALARTWLGLRGMAPMGFVVHIEPFTELAEKNLFVAEREGELIGMVALAPLYARGFLIEDLFRNPNAPNGTTEALVDAAMKHAAKHGSHYVTLGLAPLAGDVSKSLRAFREHASILFDFRGLEAFKKRLRPAKWDPIFIAHTPDISSAHAVAAVLQAFARGSFVRFGIETLMRGPPVAIWTLAILLVPWTIGLASFNAEKWFPSLFVQAAWVVFDVGLAIAMLSLAKRWRASLAFALAIIVTIDTIITVIEALAFNVARVETPLDAFLVSIACLAPAAASIVVWGSWRRRR